MFSSELVKRLATSPGRPWMSLLRGKPIDERWLGRKFHPYGIRPRNLRISEAQAKGYYREEVLEFYLRYVTKTELKALMDEVRSEAEEAAPGNGAGGTATGQAGNGG